MYRSQLVSGDVLEVYDMLRRRERAVYNRQSAEICVKHGAWGSAIREVLPALYNDPTSLRTPVSFGLSLLPPPVSRKLLKLSQPF
jgi:hypothetical protein